MTYLEKVPEVKDTVHKQSLLHHACSVVVENFPQSTDLYSEIGAITRSAKVSLHIRMNNSFIYLTFTKSNNLIDVPTGGFRPAAGEPVSDGAALQSIMGPSEGDC